MKGKTLIFLIFIYFCLINLVDIITAHFIIPGESNPIFVWTKSFYPVIFLKIGICVFFYYVLKKILPTFGNIFFKKYHMYFLLLILIYGSFIVSVGVGTNIYGILHPSVLIESAKISTVEKVKYYVKFIFLLNFIPIFLSWFSFYIWEKLRIEHEGDSLTIKLWR